MKIHGIGNDAAFHFSNLERDILECLWNEGEGRTGILHKLLGEKRGVTHSTIAVTLARLHQKGVLTRKPELARGGTRFVYYPKFSKEEFGDHLAVKFVNFLRKSFGEACVANLKKKVK